jgi:alpha-galactosidase
MRHATRTLTISFFALFLTIAGTSPAVASTLVSQAGDAAIAHDTASGTWLLSAGGATLTLALDPTRDFSLLSLVSPSGKAWASAAATDSFMRAGNQMLPFGSLAAGFSYQGVTIDSSDRRLQLNAIFTVTGSGLKVTRHYAMISGSPSFEAWTSYAPGSTPITLSDLNALQLNVPAGTIRWLTGLQGDTADVPTDTAFTLEQKTLAVGQQFTIGARGRASEQAVPWFAIDGAEDEFYAALMWSGAWSLGFDRTSSGLGLTFGLPPMSTRVQAPVDGPHVVFGVAAGGLTEATAALRSYVLDGIRGGRPLTPLVTYNTWFAYGTEIDEGSMRGEMERAAALGAELFVLDAGWYEGTGAAGPFDFDAGLGSWTPDPARFPNGLRPLTDYAHSLGLLFGIWVEPERVNLSLVGAPGVAEDWLATTGGDYGSDHAGQICLASAAARQWLMDRLTGLIDDVQPDYLKWDNNMFINCDRDGHGHGATDGNFAHVNGLYDLLSTLRDRYPNLLVENVSGGGNRLDVGMLRYTDVAWMDDRTAPSVHVRHNLEGLSAVFPPAYLLSFVTDHDTEPLHGSPDLSLYFRSRMDGALGLCFRSDSFAAGEEASIAREIEIYKAMRSTLSVAAAALLTKQAAAEGGPSWDVLQESTSSNDQVVISAFQSDERVQTINVKPTGLQATTTYQVQSVDTGVLGTATGAELMTGGIDLVPSPNSAAHILIITAKER